MNSSTNVKAIDVVKQMVADGQISQDVAEKYFPELKESEDKRIKKNLIDLIYKVYINTRYITCVEHEDMLAWLEKQGEQKPVISNDALREGIAHFGITQYQIDNWLKKYVDVEKQGEQSKEATYTHEVVTGNGNIKALVTEKVQLPKFKVGDKIRRKTPSSCDKDMQVARIEKDYYICNHISKFSSEVVPFSKESSYELIEQKPAEFDDTNAKRMFIKALERVEEQNNKGYKLTDCDKNSWWEDFKTYTSCTVEQKPAWSEEDRKIIIELIGIFESAVDGGHVTFPYRLLKDYIRILKSCIPQRRWKPTEKQMYNLSEAAHYNCAFFDMEILKGLYDDLKQL